MTNLEALKVHVKYPLDDGLCEFVLMKRGLVPDEPCTPIIANSREFKGARADILCELIDSTSFSEEGVNISIANKNLLIKIANKLYEEIGEPTLREYASDGQKPPTIMAYYE